MAAENLNEEMVATYSVVVTGIERTKAEMAKLDSAIRHLRAAQYSPNTSMTRAAAATSAKGGGGAIFVSKIADLEGRIQTAGQKAMLSGMDMGKTVQKSALEAAVTPWGEKRPGKGPGRNETGAMIAALKRNVEVFKTGNMTFITGWHGWSQEGKYFEFQELGTNGRGTGVPLGVQRANGSVSRKPNKAKQRTAGKKRGGGAGVPAANSLGQSIIPVREYLKRELDKLR